MKAEHDFASLYKRRLKEPQPGDQVQVLWEGSFNLVSSNGVTAYEGRAWCVRACACRAPAHAPRPRRL